VPHVYLRLVTGYVVHIANIMLASATFGQYSCCVWPRNLLADRAQLSCECCGLWPLRTTAADVNLLFIDGRKCK
jgi:hypothetical protein